MRFPELEKEILELAANYGCQDLVKYSDYDDPRDKDWVIFPAIDVKLGRFRMRIDVDERWGGVLRFGFTVTYPSKRREGEVQSGMVFLRKYYPSYLPKDVKLRDFDYQMPVSRRDWENKMKSILEIALKNRKALEHDCEKACLRDEYGNAKKRWEEWRSDAKVLKIENHNDGEIVQGIKQDKQGQYDSSPLCFGSNGTYYVPGENKWIMKYRIKHRAQDAPCPISPIVPIESFMKEKLLPSLGYQRVSSQLKQRLIERLQSRKLIVVTRDFGEDGFVSQDAEFLPVGFTSWNAYLEDVFKDWLR